MAFVSRRFTLKTILMLVVLIGFTTTLLYKLHQSGKKKSLSEPQHRKEDDRSDNNNNNNNNKKWNKVEQMMRNNMENAELVNRAKVSESVLQKLPKPVDLAPKAIGPVKRKKKASKLSVLETFLLILKSLACPIIETGSAAVEDQLILVGRPGSGLSAIAKTLHKRRGVFFLQLEQANPQDTLYALTNLSRCAFKLDKSKTGLDLSHNQFIMDACEPLAESTCLSSPSLLKDLCNHFPLKSILAFDMSMENVRLILDQTTTSLTVVYVSRDPRAMLYDSAEARGDMRVASEVLCNQLTQDLSVIDHKMPKFRRKKNRFYSVRYEEFAMRPDQEMENILKGFNSAHKFCSDDSVTNMDLDSVDEWKQKLSMEEVNSIEDVCGNVLNRLEYPIYGTAF